MACVTSLFWDGILSRWMDCCWIFEPCKQMVSFSKRIKSNLRKFGKPETQKFKGFNSVRRRSKTSRGLVAREDPPRVTVHGSVRLVSSGGTDAQREVRWSADSA